MAEAGDVDSAADAPPRRGIPNSGGTDCHEPGGFPTQIRLGSSGPRNTRYMWELRGPWPLMVRQVDPGADLCPANLCRARGTRAGSCGTENTQPRPCEPQNSMVASCSSCMAACIGTEGRMRTVFH